MLFNSNYIKISEIKEIGFSNEKELQGLCEQNLELLLNLEFIATEFSVADYRIDTLAYDKENNAFIIIEYKNTKINSVIDQGYSYLSTMLNNKADFVLKFSQVKGQIFDIKDINWGLSRVFFVSPQFTQYQEGAINFQGLPIELWKIKKFDNNIITFEQIGTSNKDLRGKNAHASITEIMPTNQESNVVAKEIKTYLEEDLVSFGIPEIQDLYASLKEFIINENEDIIVKATKLYVGFYKNRTPLVSIKIYQKSLVIWLNDKFGNIEDPKKIIKDMSTIGHHGVGDCQINVQDDSSIGYIQDIIKKHLQNKGLVMAKKIKNRNLKTLNLK